MNGEERRLKGGKGPKDGPGPGPGPGVGKDSLVGGLKMGDQPYASTTQVFSVSSGNCRCEYPHEGIYRNGRQLRSRHSFVDVNGVTVFPPDYFACRKVVYVCKGDFFYGPLWNYDCMSSGNGAPYRGSVVILPSEYPLCACPSELSRGSSTSSNGQYLSPPLGSSGFFHYSHEGNGLNYNVFNLQPGKKGKRTRRRTTAVTDRSAVMKNPLFEYVFESRIGKGKDKGGKGQPKGKSKAKGAKKGKSKKGVISYNPTFAPFRCPPTPAPAGARTPSPTSAVKTVMPTISEFPTIAPVANATTTMPSQTPSSPPTLHVLSPSPSVSEIPTRFPHSKGPSIAGQATSAPTNAGTTHIPTVSAIPTLAFAPTHSPTVAPTPSSIAPSTAVPTPTSSIVPSDVPSFIPSIGPSKIGADLLRTTFPTVQIEAFPTSSPTVRVVAATSSPTTSPTVPVIHSPVPSLLPYCREPVAYDEDAEPTLQPSTNPQPTPPEVVGVTCRLRSPTSAPSLYPTLDSSDMNEVIACIAIIDDAENTTAESLNLTWFTFRSKYPSRSFCLLQPMPNEPVDLKIPAAFDVDPKSIYSPIARDYAAGALASSWFRLCNLGVLRSQGINKIAVFIDDWNRVTARQVRASYEFFLLDITSQGISLVRAHEGADDNWVTPFVRDFH